MNGNRVIIRINDYDNAEVDLTSMGKGNHGVGAYTPYDLGWRIGRILEKYGINPENTHIEGNDRFGEIYVKAFRKGLGGKEIIQS